MWRQICKQAKQGCRLLLLSVWVTYLEMLLVSSIEAVKQVGALVLRVKV